MIRVTFHALQKSLYPHKPCTKNDCTLQKIIIPTIDLVPSVEYIPATGVQVLAPVEIAHFYVN